MPDDEAPSADRDLVAGVRRALAAAGDPERARGQRAYMRSALPYHGVRVPAVRTIVRRLTRDWSPTRARHEATVRALWDGAGHREERYAALAVARHPAGRRWLDAEALPLWRHLVVTGAWWDLVDETAAHLVGASWQADPEVVGPVLRGWAAANDVWLRRTAVLAQLRAGRRTDPDLLHAVVDATVDDDSFWLRKAVGWALRSYARTDPAWVRAEVDRLGDRLSPLSRREATRHLPRTDSS